MPVFTKENNDSIELTDSEKEKLISEIRNAKLIADQISISNDKKSIGEKTLSILSNGFILLLLGTLITSWIVPRFQRQYEVRKQKSNLMQECLSQFQLYSNSIWQEYYAILPLTLEINIDKKTYLENLEKIAQIKLKRYNSFAKLEALSIVFRDSDDDKPSNVETELQKYAISLNVISSFIDKWLTGLYCTPSIGEDSPCESFEPRFDPFNEYLTFKEKIIRVGNDESDKVAALIVKKIKNINK